MNDYSGSISLLIYGEGLNFASIERDIKMEANRKTRKGTDLFQKKIIAQRDSISFEIKYVVEDSWSEKANDFLDKLLEKKTIIQDIMNDKTVDEVKIRLFVQSMMAQILLPFHSGLLSKISNLDIDFELSILSWGGAYDEKGDDISAE